MDPETQANIKKIAEGDDNARQQLVVVLGASDIEGAEISAETVTFGDPSFAGPLAGVPLGLSVYHILEPDLRTSIPEDIYEEALGIWTMAADVEEIGTRFRAIRDKVASGATSMSG
jgi:glycine/sarcosine/betaine reductase complex component A